VRGKRGREGGGLWLFIAGLALRRGLGLREGEGDRRPRGVVRVQEILPELDDDLTSGPRLSAGGGAGQIPFRVGVVLGRGLLLGLGQNGPLWPFFFF
jgi:hypothetical protein